MILLFDLLSKIDSKLNTLIRDKKILNFKITLRVNNRATVYIVIENEDNNKIIDKYLDKHACVEFEYLSPYEVETDPYFKELFESNESIFLDSRKNLSNLLELNNNERIKINSKVVTFYSYKGGVGRSTTLASCAAFLSNHYNKRILILDCDLEAPGFTNFFLEEPSQVNNHLGIVEYFMDLDYLSDKIDFSKYIWEVGKDYSGNGSIFVMPAGNLSEDYISGNQILTTHKKHYLEGLARIDISSSFNMFQKFSTLLKQADELFSPDVILIDSRTGFNDIFGVTAFAISDLVVGFFGNNVQNLPGLNYFIDRIVESKNGLNAILINAIIPARSFFTNFSDYVENYIQRVTPNENDNFIVIKTFPITHNPPLGTIGTNYEHKEDFIDLIRNQRFSDYNEIFSYINSIINVDSNSLIQSDNDESNHYKGENLNNHYSFYQEIEEKTKFVKEHDINQVNSEISNIEKYLPGIQKNLKKIIIQNLFNNWPNLYAEQVNIEPSNVFYRRSMEDIFNDNKFIILGNKGTGKTFLYEALKQPEVVKKIQERSQKNGIFEFMHIIDKKSNKFFDTNLFNNDLDENFYHKFWVIYIWNAIMLESENRLGYKSNLEVLPINNDTRTKLRFEEYINNDKLFIKIEEDLRELEDFLKHTNNHMKLIVIFDGLDHVVKPINWPIKIVPLINYWRYHNFTRISPKLFLRSDLFEKLSNITNIKELKNQAISIEWSQDELFGYFFKLVFSSAKEEFLKYMILTKIINFELIKQIKQKSNKDNQLPLEEYYLKPLVQTFFGQYASADNTPRFGESYDWFYRNLKNANNTISLRPFIDLINNALGYAKSNDNTCFPILPASYYVHGEARKVAVGNHFSDLVSEQGNEYLKFICDYIREKKSRLPVYLDISKVEMEVLLKEIINDHQLTDNSVDDLIYLLKVNGIIKEDFRSNGIFYSFALLYKYYLGLKNRPKRERK